MRTQSGIVIALLLAGCNGSSTDSGSDDFTESITSPYSIGSGLEQHQCTRMNVSGARWVEAFTPSLGAGVHRMWLAVDETPESAGTAACSPGLEGDWRLLFVAGPGTDALTLPEDVGFAIDSGDQLVLYVRLVNGTVGSLTGNATIQMRMSGTTLGEEAEAFLAGSATFLIQGSTTMNVSGECTFPMPTSIFAVTPIMNAIGTHARVWTELPTHTFVDRAYSHDDQAIETFSPYDVDAGDQIRTEFTYVNPTTQSVTYGFEQHDELSFAMTYVTPPVGLSPACF